MEYSFWQWVALSASSIFACMFGVQWYLSAGRTTRLVHDRPSGDTGLVYLFDGCDLVSASNDARSILAGQSTDTDWRRLHRALADRFPYFPESPEAVSYAGRTIVDPYDSSDPWSIQIEPVEDGVRVELNLRDASQDPDHVFHPLNVQQSRHMRIAAEQAPCPIWKTDSSGQIVWKNAAYTTLIKSLSDSDDAPFASAQTAQGAIEQDDSIPVRHALTHTKTSQTIWYDVTSIEVDGGRMHYAQDVGPVVRAESAQRKFVQTLSKTFAQLSIGLAIFDRQMQLVLFNPALIDLTDLPADFLSMRPNLLTLFDRLRDARVMPEPKDYPSWREKMSSLVAAANDGSYHETWTLPSGATYRVTGRPHPDGAVAFLFEDISAEVSLTRRFRSELEMSQSVLNEMDSAVAVFSANGVLAMTNEPFRQMWKISKDQHFAEMTVVNFVRIWQDVAGASPLWGELRDFVLGREHRENWTGSVDLPNGGQLTCKIHPIQNGATLIRMMREDEEDCSLEDVLINAAS